MRGVVLFAFKAFESIASGLQNLLQLQGGMFGVSRFENGEMHLDIQTWVDGERCLILGSISPPDERMLATLLLAHTLKKEKAREITAILPYMAYARHDKDKPGQSMGTAWAGSIFKASGCDRVITVDLHSDTARRLFPIPVISLSPAGVFADAIQQHDLCDAIVVAPDEGAIPRCEAVRVAAGMPPAQVPYFEKHRTEKGIVHAGPIGRLGPRAVIIDDILDTGTTLVSACQRLVEVGVKETYVMVTHGLFTGEGWKRLCEVGVKGIFCTDSIPRPSAEMANVQTLSIVPLLASHLVG